jgi:peptidoglycan hydrolase CwlO-like protein
MEETTFAGFKVLEEKIEKAADVIRSLRQEKERIEKENNELKSKLNVLYNENEELAGKVDQLQQEERKQEDLNRVREEISDRIEMMLGKLEKIDI